MSQLCARRDVDVRTLHACHAHVDALNVDGVETGTTGPGVARAFIYSTATQAIGGGLTTIEMDAELYAEGSIGTSTGATSFILIETEGAYQVTARVTFSDPDPTLAGVGEILLTGTPTVVFPAVRLEGGSLDEGAAHVSTPMHLTAGTEVAVQVDLPSGPEQTLPGTAKTFLEAHFIGAT